MTPSELTELISEDELQKGVARLAREIGEDYANTGLVMVCVLKGSFIFTSDLLRQLSVAVHRVEFVKASSYGSGTESVLDVRVESSLGAEQIRGQHALLVDDIADTGKTFAAVSQYLRDMEPASLRCCTLLNKPDRREVDMEYDYVGFTIPNRFVVGYGMDLDDRYRGLPAVYCLSDR